MNTGLIAFLVGVLGVVIAWIAGKANGTKETTTKISGEVTIQRQRAEKAEDEKDLAQSTATIVQEQTAQSVAIMKSLDDFDEKFQEAKKDGNTNAAIEAAQRLAEMAQSWRSK